MIREAVVIAARRAFSTLIVGAVAAAIWALPMLLIPPGYFMTVELRLVPVGGEIFPGGRIAKVPRIVQDRTPRWALDMDWFAQVERLVQQNGKWVPTVECTGDGSWTYRRLDYVPVMTVSSWLNRPCDLFPGTWRARASWRLRLFVWSWVIVADSPWVQIPIDEPAEEYGAAGARR